MADGSGTDAETARQLLVAALTVERFTQWRPDPADQSVRAAGQDAIRAERPQSPAQQRRRAAAGGDTT